MSFENHHLKNYPKIKIDRSTVIKPCVSKEKAADLFIDKNISTIDTILNHIKFVADFVYSIYLYLFGLIYPYLNCPTDEVCDHFSRCFQWSNSVIRAFAWHPNHDRCAVAICNDYIHVYHGSTRIRILRNVNQTKIVDLAWQPSDLNLLAVATQTHIILWRLAEDQSTSFTLIDPLLHPPIISIQFNINKLYACSPNTYKIAVIDLSSTNNPSIEYVGKFGQGVTRILWSPLNDRLATATPSPFFRVFESTQWTAKSWPSQGQMLQDMIWSKPTGRVLLLVNKNEPCLYALPFLDKPQAGDVGGNYSLMKVLDLQPTHGESGSTIGGLVHTFAWDRNGKRLAISFRENPESVLLYKTVEGPTVEFHQLGVIQSENYSSAQLIQFHDNYKNGSLLTICWSDGYCQHIPFNYTLQDPGRNGFTNGIRLNGSSENTKSPRSMTSFCHVSDGTLTPIGKCRNQSILFSTRAQDSSKCE